MTGWTGKTALITGAASGIGKALVAEAVGRGMRVLAVDIDKGDLVQLESEYPADQVSTEVLDVADGTQVASFAARWSESGGVVDLLCNNAGVGTPPGLPLWECTPADWAWVLGVNVLGIAHMISAFVPRMIQRGEPAWVLNTSSAAGLLTPPGLGPYPASKHAVVALSEQLYSELQSSSIPIGVSVLCPFFVNTRILDSERLRPVAERHEDVASGPAAQMMRASLASAWSPSRVAAAAFDAVTDGAFYIIPDEAILPAIAARCDDLLALRKPTPVLPPEPTE